MTLLMLAVAAMFQQPQAAAPRQTPQPNTAFDSSVAAISDIGIKVAETRSVYDLYRRAAFNEPDGALMDRATMYGASCRALSNALRDGHHAICLHCLPARIQPVVDQYRTYLPTLERFSVACASRIDQLKERGTTTAQTKALRDDVIPAGNRMVTALRGYEVRLQGVRQAMGWVAPNVPTPRRGG